MDRGALGVENVRGAVVVEVDGSGGIDVNGVSGDFTVRRDGSGGVHYARVAGKVNVPRDEVHGAPPSRRRIAGRSARATLRRRDAGAPEERASRTS